VLDGRRLFMLLVPAGLVTIGPLVVFTSIGRIAA